MGNCSGSDGDFLVFQDGGISIEWRKDGGMKPDKSRVPEFPAELLMVCRHSNEKRCPFIAPVNSFKLCEHAEITKMSEAGNFPILKCTHPRVRVLSPILIDVEVATSFSKEKEVSHG